MKLKKWVEEEIRRIKENGFWFWSETVAPYKDTDPEIKLLRETREQFQDILAKANRENLIANMLNPSAPLTPAVALKHAMIASDVGAELLDRAKDFIIFYKITRLTVARPGEPLIRYALKALGNFKGRLSNKEIAKANLDLLSDLGMLVFFGSQLNEFKNFPSFKRCLLGKLCGNSDALTKYFAGLYVEVSRQIMGKQTAKSGEAPQDLVRRHLERRFSRSKKVRLRPDRRIPNFPGGKERQFDLVVEITTPKGETVYTAVEVAFQETTNSVIERKAREAVTVFRHLKAEGNFLCYVVDGAGYFARLKALADITENSHRRFTFKKSELDALCDFLQEIADGRHA